MKEEQLLKRIRLVLLLFMAGLVISGVTAFPLETEVEFLAGFFSRDSVAGEWLHRVLEGLIERNRKYPFMAYGTDWLAFAHLVIAVVFLGPWRDPVKNIWVIEFGMIACVMVIPLALIAGAVRGIPVWWRMIDCSFGVIGMVLLVYAWVWTKQLERGRQGRASN